jgi:hypothetical protein
MADRWGCGGADRRPAASVAHGQSDEQARDLDRYLRRLHHRRDRFTIPDLLGGASTRLAAQEWRYYVCRKCGTPSVRADDAERVVLEAIKTMTLPPRVIDEARSELARRLDVPRTDLIGTKRLRLETRLNRLTQLYGWGEIKADEYRRQMSDTRTMLAELPDPNKLVAFDRNRNIMVTMAENVEKATRLQLAELVQLLVERVQAKERVIDPATIEWAPPARPFFEGMAVAPPGGLKPPTATQRPRLLPGGRLRRLPCLLRSVLVGARGLGPTHRHHLWSSPSRTSRATSTATGRPRRSARWNVGVVAHALLEGPRNAVVDSPLDMSTVHSFTGVMDAREIIMGSERL